MNKKQGAIIVTLLALIVCMGLLATRLNNPLYVQGTGEKSAISLKSSDKKDKAVSSSNYFVEARMARDNKTTQALQGLKAVMEDKNISQEQRDKVVEEYTSLTMATTHENKVELNLLAKGYEDVVCLANKDKVTVTVKVKEKLTDKQTKEIQSVVMSETKIKNVEIQEMQ